MSEIHAIVGIYTISKLNLKHNKHIAKLNKKLEILNKITL